MFTNDQSWTALHSVGTSGSFWQRPARIEFGLGVGLGVIEGVGLGDAVAIGLGVGAATGVGEATGVGAATFTPLLHTNFFPDLIQV